MSDPSLKSTLNRGLLWEGLSTAGVGITAILSLVLLLKFWVTTTEYGIATTVVTLLGIIDFAVEVGMTAAVIQRDDHNEERLSTLFWFNVLVASCIYGVIFFTAPLMAMLHGHAVITDLFRIQGLTLFLRAGYSNHRSLMRKELRFKELAYVRMAANVAAFVAMIGSGIAGEGVWCWTWGVIARQLVYFVGTVGYSRWMPRFVFRVGDTINYIAFGLRTSAGQILLKFYSDIDYQIVNVAFGAEALGLYRAAYELVLQPVKFLSQVVVGVAFPAFSKLKDDMPAVVEQYISFTRQNLVIVLSFVTFILLTAEDMLAVVLKPEYEVAATAARILALVGLLRSLSFICPPLLDGLGRPDLTLRYQAVATVVLTGLFVLFAWLLGEEMGFMSVALAWAVGYPVAFAVLSWLVLGMVKLSPLTYLRRIVGIPACMVGAGLGGLLARALLADLAPSARLLAVLGVTAVLIVALLAIFQDIHPRSIKRAMRD